MTKAAKDMTAEEMYQTISQNYPNSPSLSTPFAEATRDFLIANIWKSDLSWREKRLISLTCTAIAAHEFPLEVHIYEALKSGDFTLDEIQAWALHVAAYAGFPTGVSAEAVIEKVRADLDKEGVTLRATPKT